MKTKITKTVAITLLALIGWSNYVNAQGALFKDLNPGSSSSQPDQFMEVNGTMYFHTNAAPTYNHQLWKSDGTAANTVLLKDNIISSSIGDVVYFRANMSGFLYFSVQKNGTTASDTTHLWKTDGTTPVLVITLTHTIGGGSGGSPSNFTVVGNQLFFQMGKNNGRELWVTDGTAAGTMEVIDLNPGDNGAGTEYSGAADLPMIAFNGKVYFQGSASLGGKDLYSSDGTAGGTTLVKANIDPKSFIVYKNELYFHANDGTNDGIWKTDGTTSGTVNISNTGFNNNTKIFKNEMFYSVGGNLWKSDGTTSGTMLVMDSAGGMMGANNDYFFTSYMKGLTAPPWFEMRYWKSDGTTGGTARVSDSLGASASFNVLNNKMYRSTVTGIWETDGTDAGTKKLLSSGVLSSGADVGFPFVFNSTLFFTNFASATGYELWSLTPSGGTGINGVQISNSEFQIFPNPTTGIVKIEWSGNKNASLQVFNILGEEILQQSTSKEITLSNEPNGIYFVRITSDGKAINRKIILTR